MGKRPFILVAFDESINVADLELDLRLTFPAIVDALQVVVEEPLLQFDAVVGVKWRPVRASVHLEPLLLGGRAHEALEVAPSVQSLATPVGSGKQRHRDL